MQAEQTARTRLALAEETAHIAATLSEAETARFEAGARTASAVLEAQNELRLAQLRALRARVDVLVAHIAAAHLTGTLDATDW